MVNVGKCTSPMDAMGSRVFLLSIKTFEVISESMVVGSDWFTIPGILYETYF